ncbi:hypothetical protein [Dechloromonas sp.]|uniref:hypothetical protein n=1 Tax=Dechloromonas sp. TaxID=1917218 RepID=UPI00216E8003|nr:hypothetical protein [Dechloromonas sp.]MBU3695253.1 hypothetical protein [Dechloromonas sp.]
MSETARRLLLPLLFLSALPAQAAGEFYCCQDPASGRRVCGDSLPGACRGQSYRLIDNAGNVIKEVGKPLTPEQRAEQVAQDKLRKQQEELVREKRRKDQALLDTYSLPEDIDLAQGKAEADVNFSIKAAQRKISEVQERRAKLLNEAEFYKKKALPAELDRDLKATEHEIKVQQELIDVKQHDLATIKTKYDADRKRYFELTGRSSSPVRPANSASAQTAPAGPY